MSKSRPGQASTRETETDASGAGPVSASALRAPLTDRVNADPPIFHGMTAGEGMKIAVACLLIYGMASGLLAMLTGWLPILPIGTLLGSGATVWYASLYLAKIKRGRPEHYYNQVIQIWLAEHGIGKKVLLRRSGYWSVGRDMPPGVGGFDSPLRVHQSRRRATVMSPLSLRKVKS